MIINVSNVNCKLTFDFEARFFLVIKSTFIWICWFDNYLSLSEEN